MNQTSLLVDILRRQITTLSDGTQASIIRSGFQNLLSTSLKTTVCFTFLFERCLVHIQTTFGNLCYSVFSTFGFWTFWLFSSPYITCRSRNQSVPCIPSTFMVQISGFWIQISNDFIASIHRRGYATTSIALLLYVTGHVRETSVKLWVWRHILQDMMYLANFWAL